jgi:Kef-type K+ transport system membrane component KefB
MNGASIFLFMVQVLVVLGLARVLGELFRWIKQPPLAGEILAGLLLGQTVLGHLAPDLYLTLFPLDELQDAMFGVVAEIGILFLLLVVGLEVNVASAWRMRNQTFTVAVTGVIVPLALGTAVAWLLYDQWVEVPTPRLAFALLVGAGVAITAITVVARLLFDLKIIKSDLGLFLISAMALNELLGWGVLAVVLGLVGAGAVESGGEGTRGLAWTMIGVVLFAAFALTLGRSLATRAFLWMERVELPSPAAPLSLVVCFGLLGGIITGSLGIHPVFGFLVAGMMAGDPKALSEHTRSIIEQMVGAIFVPLFFAGICLRVDFVSDFDAVTVASVTALSIVGKFAGAGLGTLMVRMPAADRLPVAIAHIPGGPMGVLLASVALEAGVIGPRMFVALVIASIVSALVVGPAFSWQFRRAEMQDVSAYIAKDRVVSLRATSRADAIQTLADVAARAPGAPASDVIRRAVAAREATMGTGVGKGIAIPHARIPGLQTPIVAIGICKEGIEWDEIDGKPAHLVFLVLTSERDERDSQLKILAQIARCFSDPQRTHDVVDAMDTAGVWTCLQASLKAVD